MNSTLESGAYLIYHPRSGRRPDAITPRGNTAHISRGKIIQYAQHRLLSALPPEEFERLAPHLTEKLLTFKQSLSKAHEPCVDDAHARHVWHG